MREEEQKVVEKKRNRKQCACPPTLKIKAHPQQEDRSLRLRLELLPYIPLWGKREKDAERPPKQSCHRCQLIGFRASTELQAAQTQQQISLQAGPEFRDQVRMESVGRHLSSCHYRWSRFTLGCSGRI